MSVGTDSPPVHLIDREPGAQDTANRSRVANVCAALARYGNKILLVTPPGEQACDGPWLPPAWELSPPGPYSNIDGLFRSNLHGSFANLRNSSIRPLGATDRPVTARGSSAMVRSHHGWQIVHWYGAETIWSVGNPQLSDFGKRYFGAARWFHIAALPSNLVPWFRDPILQCQSACSSADNLHSPGLPIVAALAELDVS